MGNSSSSRPSTPSLAKRWHSTQTQLSVSSSYSAFSIASVQRPFSRKARKKNQLKSLSPLSRQCHLEASKTNWPTPLVETIFLPEFPIKSRVYESQFKILEQIAHGAFGSVFKVCKKDSGVFYAMKVLNKSQVLKESAIQQCKDEVTIQSILGHFPFISKCEYYWQNRKHLYILTNYVAFGELLTLWNTYGTFSENLVRIFIAELGMTLDFLHNAGVIYRDLKMENILLDENGHVQLIDFGLSKWLSHGCKAQTICGTLQYMAPEILSLEPYTHAVDWWSLGIIMYALLVGSYPVEAVKDHEEMKSVVTNSSFQLPDTFSDNAKLALRKLLCKRPQKRLQNLHNLKFEPFFRSLDFDDLLEGKVSPKNLLNLEIDVLNNGTGNDVKSEKGVKELIHMFENF